VVAFTRSLESDSTRLVETINKIVTENEEKKAQAFVVIAAPQDELESKAKELAEEKDITIPLTFFSDGPDGKGAKAYKLDPEVPVTILIAKGNKVQTNIAVEKITDETLEAVVKAFEKALEG